MSATIDEKVVEMRFDGRDFERNARESISVLDKLKQSLKLDGAAKGFENVGAAANRLSLDGLANAADAVVVKFSYMQMALASQFNKIVDSAVSAGKRVVSAFTTEPIKTGFQEYETQINAVQTILANTSSKGTTIDDVNLALDTLNAYADKTIYNFTEMTRNIGTFTAAGIELDTATQAIQGIANLAAVSGSTSQQASTAMYQMSQALSSGTLKLQDWNSVVNAGMGGQVFQDALKETSKYMVQQAKNLKKMNAQQRAAWQTERGYSDDQMKALMAYSVDVDKLIAKKGSFRESLSEGWITSDVLTMTLNKMTKSGVIDYVADLTGATKESVAELQTLGDTLGYDSEQAMEMAMSITKGDEAMAKSVIETVKMATTAEDAATKVKTFTQLMDTLKEAAQSGWTQTWEMLVGDFEEAKALWTSVSDYFGEIINNASEARNSLIREWIDLGGRHMLIDGLLRAFNGLVSIVTQAKEAFREIFPSITAMDLLNITLTFQQLGWELEEFATTHGPAIKTVFTAIFSVIDIGLSFVKSLVKGIADLATNFTGFTGTIFDGVVSLSEWFIGLRKTINETDIFGVAVGKVVGFVQKVIDKLKEFAGIVASKIQFPSLEAIADVLGKIWTFVTDIAKSIGSVLGDITTSFGDFLADTDMASVMKVLNGSLLAGVFVKLTGLVKNGSGILGSLKETIDGIKDMLLGLAEKKEGGGLLDALKDSLASMQEAISVNKIIKIAAAVGILAVSLKVISTIDSEKMSFSLLTLAGVFGELVGALAIFEKLNLSGSGKGLASLIGLAASVLILSFALKNLGDLDWGQISRGLVAMGGVMLELIGFVKLMGNSKVNTGSMIGLIALALSLKVFASALEDFAAFSWDQIKTGLAGMGGVLLELGIFTKLVSGSKNMVSIGVGLIAVAAAMKIFASAMADFAVFNWDQIIRGLAAMGGVLLEVAIATRLMPKNMVGIGAGLLIVSGAMHVMASALAKFGDLTTGQIIKGLASIGILLLELAIALRAMKGTLGGAAALLVASAALVVLSVPLLILSKIKWTSLAKGLIAIAAAMAIVGVAGSAFGSMAGTMLMGAVALAAMGAAMLILVPTIAAFGAMKLSTIIKGVLGLAAAFVVVGGVAAILGYLSPMILAFGAAILVVSAAVAVFGVGLTAIGVGLSMIGGALEVFVTAVGNSAESLMANIEMIVYLIVQTIAGIVDGIVLLAPKFAEAGMTILLSILQGVNNNIFQVVTTVGEIITNFLNALAEQLPIIIAAGMNLIVQFLNGLAVSMEANSATIGTAMYNVFVAALNTVVSFLTGGAVTSVKDAARKIMDSGFVRGIRDKATALSNAFKNTVANAKTAVTSKVSEWISIGKDIINGLIDGIKQKFADLKATLTSGLKEAIRVAKEVLRINSPSKVFASMGRSIDEGLVYGINADMGDVLNATEDLGNATISRMADVVSHIAEVIDNDIDAQPSIRPVLDLSDVERGTVRLNSMLSRNRAMTINTAMNGRYASEASNGATSGEATYQFVQNNYSPKALSRLEIYRQTKNQLETLKGLAKA